MSDKINHKEIADEIFAHASKTYPNRKVITDYPDDVWSVDLADMNDVINYNNKYRFMLNCVDCFSRYAWSIATTNKRGPTILEGLKQIVKENNNKYPAHIWVDQGSEFYNEEVKKWCDDHDITMYSTFGRAKSAIVERFNRTIKTLLYKHFYAVQNKRWVKILPQFIKEYNERPHKGLPAKLTPAKVHAMKNDEINYIYDYQTSQIKTNKEPQKFKVGDLVRLSRIKSTFEKGYHQKWTSTIYKISKAVNTIPWTYNIVDVDDDEPYTGSFYEQELQLTKTQQ